MVIPVILEEQRSESPYPTPPSAASFAGSPSPPSSPKKDLLSPLRFPSNLELPVMSVTPSPSITSSSGMRSSLPSELSPRYGPPGFTPHSSPMQSSTSSNPRASLSSGDVILLTSSSSSSDKSKLKGILKPPTPCPSPAPSSRGSPSRSKTRGSLISLAKENALNFFVPMRRLTVRERRLKEVTRWWEEKLPASPSRRIVTFEIDKCTIPSKLLQMRHQRRDSLRDLMPRSPSDPDLDNSMPGSRGRAGLSRSTTYDEKEDAEGADHERRETALPSQQLRRWQKLGRVMGVAFGMRELARSYKCASDPELDFQNTSDADDGEDPPILHDPQLDTFSLHSLDTDLLAMGAPAAAYHHRQRKARRDSGTLSDCVVHGGVTFKFGSEVEIGGAPHLVVPEVAITAPSEGEGDSAKGEEEDDNGEEVEKKDEEEQNT